MLNLLPMRLIISLMFTVIVFKTFGQEVKDLGKVHFNNSPDFILSATESKGVFSYKLIDKTQNDKILFQFDMYANTIENFKNSITSKYDGLETETKDKISEPISQELDKYFFYFKNQSNYWIGNSEPLLAMKMDFNDSIPVYELKHSKMNNLKSNDVLQLINSLFLSDKSILEFKNNEFNFEFYDSLIFKNNIYKDSISNNDTLYISKFKTRLKEIKEFKPKPLKWQELYKEILYIYYEQVNLILKYKINKYEKENKIVLNDFETEIKNLENKLTQKVKDTLSYNNLISEEKINLTNYKNIIQENKNKINNQLEYIQRESDKDNDLNEKIDQYNESLKSFLKQLKDLELEIAISNEKDSTVLDTLNKNEDLEKKISKLTEHLNLLEEIKINQARIPLLESNINDHENKLVDIRSSIQPTKDSLSEEKENLKLNKKDIKEKISEELSFYIKQLNKFTFAPENIQIEINRGYIENIVVTGHTSTFIEPEFKEYLDQIFLEEKKIKFINDYPIGISSKKDIELMSDYNLYARSEDKKSSYELRLGDLITNMEQILALDRTDYSPKDSAYVIDRTKTHSKDFPKPDKKEILQIKVFSDFIGLKEENPNGLIQLEIDKEIPLVTKRITKPYVWLPFRYFVPHTGNIGLFNFIRPRFVLSKVEDNNRYLSLTEFPVLDTAGIETGEQKLGTSTLNLKQFERFVIGADLNLVLLNNPNWKSTFLLNAGMHFGRTDLASYDTISEVINKPNAHTNTYQPSYEVVWRVTGDERYGFQFSYGTTWIISDQFNFKQRPNLDGFENYEEFENSKARNRIRRFTLLAYLNLNADREGRLFFRYRSNFEPRNFELNYSQLQIGYTTSLSKRTD